MTCKENSTFINMSQVIKAFIISASEFDKHKDIDSVVQHLQILSDSDDLSVFDTSSFETAEFYTILYDLLTKHASSPELVWSIINVLQVIIRNPSASSALVHTYHFILPLTTILDSQLTDEKKSILLKVIQELTYGVVICWRESHLPKLIKLLLDIITSGDNELVPVALGVMVNLCHKNKPAIYTLMNCINMKILLRTVLNLQRDNVETSVQVCKLLMVLNQLSGNVPDSEILSFVRVSYLRIQKAFIYGNTSLMRHIVDFFRDAKESDQGRKVLLTYPKYQEETDNLINELSKKIVPNNWQCVHQLLEFMQQLVDLEQAAMLPLFPRLAHSVLPWVQVGGVARSSLDLLTAMLCQSRSKDTDVYKALTLCMQDHLQMFIEMLHNGCRTPPSSSEEQASLTSLFHLLHELVSDSSLSEPIACAVNKEDLKKLLLPLTTMTSDKGQLFQQSVTALCVEALSFVSELSMDDKEWLFLYSDLLQKKQILKALAIGLYFGSFEVKKQILYLAGTSSFSKYSLTILSKCLTDLNQLFLFTPNANNHNPGTCASYSQLEMDCSSYFTNTRADHLDGFIDKLGDLYKKDQIQDSSLSGIIELYKYKLGEMRRAELALQSSLEAADAHRVHLTQRVTQLCAETGRLHQLLYTGQQSLEGVQGETSQLREQLHTAQQAATDSHIKFKQLKQDVQSKGMVIKEQFDEISKLKQNIEEFKKKCEFLEETNAALTEKTEEQTRLIEKMEQSTASLTEQCDEQSKIIQKMDRKLLDLEDKLNELNKVSQTLEKDKSDLQTSNSKLEVAVEKKTSQIQSLEQEIANQKGFIKGLETTVKEKERELASQQTQLLELERMRKIIFEITGGKKSNF